MPRALLLVATLRASVNVVHTRLRTNRPSRAGTEVEKSTRPRQAERGANRSLQTPTPAPPAVGWMLLTASLTASANASRSISGHSSRLCGAPRQQPVCAARRRCHSGRAHRTTWNDWCGSCVPSTMPRMRRRPARRTASASFSQFPFPQPKAERNSQRVLDGSADHSAIVEGRRKEAGAERVEASAGEHGPFAAQPGLSS